MDFFKLKTSDNSYKEGAIINGIISGRWTERFFGGDFELVFNDGKILDVISTGDLISHSETLAVMMVETIYIEEGEDIKIFLSGRSLEIVLMAKRPVYMSYNPWTWGSNDYKPAWFNGFGVWVYGHRDFMAQNLISLYICDKPVYSLGSLPPFPLSNEFVGEKANNVKVSLTTSSARGSQLKETVAMTEISYGTPPNVTYYMNTYDKKDAVVDYVDGRDSLLDFVTELLSSINVGIRTIRPTGDETELKIDIYRGIIRTDPDSAYYVGWNWYLGDFKSLRYIDSNATNYNVIYLVEGESSVRYVKSGVSGLNFNALVYKEDVAVSSSDVRVDNDSLTHSEKIDKKNKLLEKAKKKINEKKPTKILEAEPASIERYKYGRDYQVGDIVKVIGNYGLSDDFIVNEHILTFDENGMVSQPSFSKYEEVDF